MQLFCPKCKRAIPEPDEEVKSGISYCYGCHQYFPSNQKTNRNRQEIIIPHNTSVLRLRLGENSIQIIKDLVEQETFGLFSVFAYFFNTTYVYVNENELKIEHKPVEVLPVTYFAKHYVKQLYVKEIESSANFTKCYGLWAEVTTEHDVLLLYNLDKRVLLYLEQEIERIFGIEDKEVYGEILE